MEILRSKGICVLSIGSQNAGKHGFLLEKDSNKSANAHDVLDAVRGSESLAPSSHAGLDQQQQQQQQPTSVDARMLNDASLSSNMLMVTNDGRRKRSCTLLLCFVVL
jgi:hypothetical protein